MQSVSPLTRVSFVMMKENQTEWEAFQALFSPLVDFVAYVDYIDHYGQNRPDRMIVPLGSRRKKFCCPQLWQRMFIHTDGAATVCCIDSARSLQMGNVLEQSVRDIWTGERYRQLRRLHASGRFAEIPACAQCPLTKY
jgi:radical SAM protein with 4Fe4S-binding SPASM domain